MIGLLRLLRPIVLCVIFLCLKTVTCRGPFLDDNAFLGWRGGASARAAAALSSRTNEAADAYELLAKAVRKKLKSPDSDEPPPEPSQIVKAFKSLASSQKTFKGLDGAAHEAYQRTHSKSSDEVEISVSGRARRSAARAGAAADALGACELCELVEPSSSRLDLESPNGTLASREVLLNVSEAVSIDGMTISILVLYEEFYTGGAGVDHGGIDDPSSLPPSKRMNGRLVVVLGEGIDPPQLQKTLRVLDKNPSHVKLHKGLVANEVASVQPVLYKAAGLVLTRIEPLLRSRSESTAIHFTGRSLAGGVAAVAATILDGSLAVPGRKQKKSQDTESAETTGALPPGLNVSETTPSANNTAATNHTLATPLSGLGKARTSAVTLGAPPSLSANVQSEFITSILYGDDIICRTSKESLDRFFKRTRRALKRKGVLGKRVNWMTDTLSLATSNIKSHAHGSEGEEMRLAVPGQAFLVRPRRLGGVCSMHEVGAQLKGGREAMRAVVLWQLNDILLSKSMWKHHQLDSYIHGLDRVHLRGLHEEEEDDVGS